MANISFWGQAKLFLIIGVLALCYLIYLKLKQKFGKWL
jgi:hypothetical protein